MGGRTSFVREEPPHLQWSTMILATCVVESVSIYLDISDFGILSNLDILHSYLGAS